MSNNHQSWSKPTRWKAGILSMVALLLLARIGIGYGQTQAKDQKNIILQSSIELSAAQASAGNEAGKIHPGTPVKIMVTIKNKGQQTNPAGQIYVRYALAHPLEKEKGSMIFETEKKPLPPIEPGNKVEIAFDAPHQIPSLLDFIRDDWSLREYQAMAVIYGEEYLLGTLAITFSAHYYPGIKKELPAAISSKN